MSYKFELNKSFWSLNFSDAYQKLYEQFENKVLNLPSYTKYLESQKEYQEAIKNYKKNHNSFKYGFIIFCLFFSWIGFIVLWFKNFKYYKKLKANKLALLQQIEAAKEQCLKDTETYANEIDASDFIEGIYNLLKYQEIGPINQYLADKIINDSGLDLTCNETINPYQSSWGIWDNNKIVLNMSSQQTFTTMRMYTGTIIVPMIHGEDRSLVTLTATYSHPFSDVEIYPNRYYAYMHACERLNFEYDKKRKIKFLASKKDRLENDEFSKTFIINYNDPIQYRMVFTPHKQEIMLNEYLVSGKKVNEEDKLNKAGSYLYSNYSTYTNLETLKDKANELLIDFKTNADVNIFHYLIKLEKEMYLVLGDLFKSLKHLFTTPIMYSENHRSIINHALVDHKYEPYLPHYILNNIIREEIIHINSPCFNQIVSETKIALKEGTLNCCIMDGLSYEHLPRIIYLPPDFHHKGVGHQLVPVNYIETVPCHEQMTFYYLPIINEKSRKPGAVAEELINQLTKPKSRALQEILDEAQSNNIIFYLKENFIVAKLLANNKYDENTIKSYFQEILKILKQQNKK